MQQFVIAAFYKITKLNNYREMQPPLLELCNQQDIKGTILLAEEGINATIAGTYVAINQVLEYLRTDDRFAGLEHKESYADFQPFDRMKVRLKKEIVTLKVPQVDPTQKVGTYVDANEWNSLLADPEVILIDARNDYEVQIGTFQGANNPQTDSFCDFPRFVQQNLDPTRNKKVAMFCTGGIRCEKATSYLLQQGFEQVYHLKGGILKYLEQVPPEDSLWQGECFVFDQRVSVNHELKQGRARFCETCGHLLRDEQQPCPNCRQTS